MTPDNVIEIGRHALLITIMISAPLLLSALAVGLLIGMFQAATQINEQTLSFIPKLLAMAVALMVTGPWLLATIRDYTIRLYSEVVPSLIGV